MNAILPQPSQLSPRILSGMRPTGKMHLGHYHGVLANWAKLQYQYQCFFSVVDLHALTTHYDEPALIKSNIWDMIIDWLAVGIDPDAAHIFIQSQVPEIAKLQLLLSMITPVSWLERVPTYKDQMEQLSNKNLHTYGFLGYPLLMAADILAFKSKIIPVGEDQLPHLELTREIARRFNHLYGLKTKSSTKGRTILPLPQPLLTQYPLLPGLDGRKMSKSYHNTIMLRDTCAQIEHKIKKMPTDPARVKRSDAGEPTRCPVWPLHQVYCDNDTKAWVEQGCRSAGIGCVDCKKPLISAIVKTQQPIAKRAKAFSRDINWVRGIVTKGCKAARDVTRYTIKEVQQAMGIDY